VRTRWRGSPIRLPLSRRTIEQRDFPHLCAWLVGAIVLFFPIAARAQIQMRIIGQERQYAMAVSPLKNLSGDDNHQVSGAFTRTLTRDFELSGYFRMLDPHAYVEDAQQSGYELGQFNFADWTSINTDFLVKGAVTVNGDKVQLTAYLYDVAQQRRKMGKNFTGAVDEVPRMARRFADAALEAMTGQRGPFDSKLAFVSTGAGRFKEVYTQTIDGQELTQQTHNSTINLFPDWDQSTRYLLYLSYKSGEPGLYLADLKQRVETRITSNRGIIIGGALSPDAQLVVASIERAGATNLYLLDAQLFTGWVEDRVHLGSFGQPAGLRDAGFWRVAPTHHLQGQLQHQSGFFAQGRSHCLPKPQRRALRHLHHRKRRRRSNPAHRGRRYQRIALVVAGRPLPCLQFNSRRAPPHFCYDGSDRQTDRVSNGGKRQ
jgi:hypothetical protein